MRFSLVLIEISYLFNNNILQFNRKKGSVIKNKFFAVSKRLCSFYISFFALDDARDEHISYCVFRSHMIK